MGQAADYDSKSNEDLHTIARERNVDGLEAYRKSDLRKLLSAMDEGDEAGVQAVKDAVAARVEAANAPSRAIQERAKKNAGVPMSNQPKADVAKVKEGNAIEVAKHQQQAAAAANVVDETGAPQPKINFDASGEDIVAQIKARAESLKSQVSTSKTPVRSGVADALRMAGIDPSAAFEAPKADVFEVLEDAQYFAKHGVYQLKKGSLVSELTHDMEAIHNQAVKLQRIDPEKVKIVYSELGHPQRLETHAVAAEVTP